MEEGKIVNFVFLWLNIYVKGLRVTTKLNLKIKIQCMVSKAAEGKKKKKNSLKKEKKTN